MDERPKEQLIELTEPTAIKISKPEVYERLMPEFRIEAVLRAVDVVFHLFPQGKYPEKDSDFTHVFIPKKIIKALRNVIPRNFKVLILYVRDMRSWAVVVRGLGKDPLNRLIVTHALEALNKEFIKPRKEAVLS